MMTTFVLARIKRLWRAWRTPPRKFILKLSPTQLRAQIAAHLSTCAQQLRSTEFNAAVASEAQLLAKQLAALPGFNDIEPLYEAHRVLTRRWHSSWSDGGVSPTSYRTRLKTALVLLRQLEPDSSGEEPTHGLIRSRGFRGSHSISRLNPSTLQPLNPST